MRIRIVDQAGGKVSILREQEAEALYLAGLVHPEPLCEQLPAVDNSCLQSIPIERGSDAGKEGEGVTEPADEVTPRLCEGSAEQSEDITTTCVDDDSPRDGLRMLALSVISQAAKEDRSWFFASRTQGIFRFWATVAGLNPSWIQERIQQKAAPSHCPGLYKTGKVWWLQVYHEGRRHRVRIGRDLDWPSAVELGKAQREAVKANAAR